MFGFLSWLQNICNLLCISLDIYYIIYICLYSQACNVAGAQLLMSLLLRHSGKKNRKKKKV